MDSFEWKVFLQRWSSTMLASSYDALGRLGDPAR
jgi:hypothetical protein